MHNLIKIFILLSIIIVPRLGYSGVTSPVSDEDAALQQRQQIFDKEQQEDYLAFKKQQNDLPDNKRDKRLRKNEYWLVNKSQDLWLGIFDGKKVKVPGGIYGDIPNDTYQSQQVVRIKKNNRISQFLLKSEVDNIPPVCFNKRDAILKDEPDYMVFYSGCTLGTLEPNSQKHSGYYEILFYEKNHDTLVVLTFFPYSPPDTDVNSFEKSVRKVNDYYVYADNSAFKVVGTDKIIDVDEKTGTPQTTTPNVKSETEEKTDDESDEQEQVLPYVLQRLPQVVNNN